MSNVRDASLDLLWSLWTELGVPGRGRRHQTVAIDPEPLIVWTPHLAAGDPRLLGLAFDWCAAHAAHIAKPRLSGLAKGMPPGAVKALAGFNGALLRHGVDWQPRAEPSQLAVGRTRLALPTERPALIRFRIRALCGTTARSEVLASLLAAPKRGSQVAQLTPAGFTRRSVERILDELSQAQVVVQHGGTRRRIFRLREPESFERTVQGVGLRWIDWHRALSLVSALLELESAATASPGLRRVDAAGQRTRLEHLAEDLELEHPPGPADREDIFEAILGWGAHVIERL